MYKRGSHMLDQRGFSLTEVMVSMVILPIAILGVTSMFNMPMPACKMEESMPRLWR